MGKNIRVEFTVTGFVQGVGFRYYVYHHAIELGLKGYVKNLYNGDVVVVAEGEEDGIQKLHLILKQGPSHSKVDKVRAVYFEPENSFKDFQIR